MKTLTFCWLLTRCTIPCACHAKLHWNVQKCSIPVSFLHFWLGNVLRATTACTFLTSQLPNVLGSEHGVLCAFWLGTVLRTTTACTFSTSQLPKVLRPWCVLHILTWKCASRYNGMHFFDISTSKSGPDIVCLVHFDFQMCFAPQQRALFRQLNIQKCSEPEVFLDVFSFFTCKCASRDNGAQLFISQPTRWLRARRFSEPTFRPSGATNHWKNTVFRDFAHLHLLSSHSFSSLIFSLELFSSLTLPTSAFPSVHIVGSLISWYS